MSILIKGMKMPMGCYECPFEVWGKCMFINYNVSGAEPKSCPLVEVTTPHGRLIDASEYINQMSNHYEEYMYDVLEEMPTIIEAEEEEPNG